ncbi:MAG: arginase family protein [Acidobacteria bacterium]|nr:arginase family protein [Acidobacteriota bacterium]MCG3195254.1 Agmatinase [Thermoanaerobaculia bacterium]
MQDREKQYVVCPDLLIELVGGSKNEVRIRNKVFRTWIEAPAALLILLDFLRQPHTMEEISAQSLIDEDVMGMLLARWIVLPAEKRELLGPGIVCKAKDSIGVSCSFDDLVKLGSRTSFVVFGVPVDLLGSPGAHAGPAQTRLYSLLRGMEGVCEGEGETRVLPQDVEILDVDRRKSFSFRDQDRYAILDAGDIAYVRGESIANVGERIERLVAAVLARQMTPVMIGGDHSMTWFSLKVLLDTYPKMGVLHFDAHHDLYFSPSDLLPLRNSNPFAHARKSTSLACLRQFGLRTVEYYRKKTASKTLDPRISYWSARELQRMSPEEALVGLDRDIPYYLSFDIDCVCPEEAPETGSPVCGGLSYYQVFELMDAIIGKFDIVGADFVEVASPKTGPANRAAMITARLLDMLLLSRILSSELDSYLFEKREWQPGELP